MASNVIAAILNLQDKMSPKLIQCGKNWQNLSKEEQRAAQASLSTVNKWCKGVDKAIDRAAKWGAAVLAAGVVAGTKTGLSLSFDLETYHSQLETATKDTQRAGEVMAYAINLANKTPFEGGEMAKASAALEMAKLKTEDYLTTLGDTAAGSNRKINEVQTQFIKAFSTGQYGEFLDTINVSRQTFKDFIRENGLATNSIENTQIALKKFLDEKFGGGMEKLASTTKGAWSTITGSVKLSLARIVGMGVDGTVRVGSLLDRINGKANSIANQLVEWSEDGTVDKLADKAGKLFETLWSLGEGTYKFFSENSWARWSAAAVVGIVVVGKVLLGLLSTIATTIKNVQTLKTALSGLAKSFGFGKAASAAAAASGSAATGAASAAGTAGAAGAAGASAGALVRSAGPKIDMAQLFGQSRVSTMGMAGTKANIGSVGFAWKAGQLTGKWIDEGTSKGITDFEERLLSQRRRVRRNPFDTSKNYADQFRQGSAALGIQKERAQNIINVTVNGAEQSDDELAEKVARRIVEEIDNSW